MRKLYTTFLFLMTMIPVMLNAQTFPTATGITPQRGVFGAGLIVGEPTGISAKYWIASDRAWDFAFGASYFSDIRLHGTYLWHVDVFDNQRVPLYYGVGAAILGRTGRVATFGGTRNRHGVGFGARASIGVSYLVPTAPFDFFAEIGSILIVVPPAAFDIDFSIGVRYYF
jgi:hypothetical protein